MDAMYRKKAKEAEEALTKAKKRKKDGHVADRYDPKIRPRETHPDAVDAGKRISKNLNKLNRRLVDTPSGKLVKEEAVAINEDRGAKVVTHAAKVKASAPMAVIFSCALIAIVFMYVLSLYIQIDEYSYSIDQMEAQIAELKEEATKLEVQLESKYDLDEVERIATQEYGMVASSTLPKKYVSVTESEDVWQEAEEEEEEGFFSGFFGRSAPEGE